MATFAVVLAAGLAAHHVGKIMFAREAPAVMCENCGRDPRLPIHEGFNGYSIDENLTCLNFARLVPEENKFKTE